MTSPFFRSRLHVPRYKILLARLVDPILPWLQVGSGLSQELMTGDKAMRADGRADPLLLRTATPRWYFTTEKMQIDVLARAGEFRPPLLLLAGEDDLIADVSTARQFFAAAGSMDKTIKVYPHLRHEILRETIRESIFDDILSWLRARAGS